MCGDATAKGGAAGDRKRGPARPTGRPQSSRRAPLRPGGRRRARPMSGRAGRTGKQAGLPPWKGGRPTRSGAPHPLLLPVPPFLLLAPPADSRPHPSAAARGLRAGRPSRLSPKHWPGPQGRSVGGAPPHRGGGTALGRVGRAGPSAPPLAACPARLVPRPPPRAALSCRFASPPGLPPRPAPTRPDGASGRGRGGGGRGRRRRRARNARPLVRPCAHTGPAAGRGPRPSTRLRARPGPCRPTESPRPTLPTPPSFPSPTFRSFFPLTFITLTTPDSDRHRVSHL